VLWGAALSLSLILAAATPAAADVVLEKRVVRHFPDDTFCPFMDDYDLSFVATTSQALLTFRTESGDDSTPVWVDNVVVVDRDAFSDQDLFVDYFRSSPGETECVSATASGSVSGSSPFLHFDELSDGPGVAFRELFADASRWGGANAMFVQNRSAPDAPSSDPAFHQTGSLLMGVPGHASVQMTGLVPGHRYVVTGWATRGDFMVQIDTPPPPALNLDGGRFKIEVRWDASYRVAGGELLTDQTAGFWFNTPNSIEMVVSATDHCTPTGGTFWLMFGGTTAQRLKITVTDLATGRQKTYLNGSQTRLKTVVDKTTFLCH
jgi:hypothetical protein